MAASRLGSAFGGCAVEPRHLALPPRRHLRDLLQDEERTDSLIREHNGLYVDFSRQNVTQTTLQVGTEEGAGAEERLQRLQGWPPPPPPPSASPNQPLRA